jgi:aromatic ring hydroxylase
MKLEEKTLTLGTKKDYVERLKKMEKNVYIAGEKVGHVDKRLIPGINVVSVTFDMVHDPELARAR